MNEFEFLNELKRELGGLSEEERGEILNDFKEHFRGAREQGRSDEEIIRSLGEPKVIAKQFGGKGSKIITKADEPVGSQYRAVDEPTKKKKGNKLPIAIIAIVLLLMAATIATGRGRRYARIEEVKRSDTEVSTEVEISEMVSKKSATEKDFSVKDLSEIITPIETSEMVSEKSAIEKNFSVKDLSEINIEITNADVSVFLSKSEKIEVKIIQNNNKKIDYEFDEGSTRLTIKQIQKTKFNIDLGSEMDEIYIGIPSKFDKDLIVEQASGDIDIKNITGRTFEITLASGDLDIDDLNFEDMFFDVASGDVDANNIVANNLEISSASGDSEYEGTINNASVSLASGGSEIDFKVPPKSLDVSIASGMLEVGFPKKTTIDLTHNIISGKIDNNIKTDPDSSTKVSVDVVSGRVSIGYKEK